MAMLHDPEIERDLSWESCKTTQKSPGSVNTSYDLAYTKLNGVNFHFTYLGIKLLSFPAVVALHLFTFQPFQILEPFYDPLVVI